MSTKTKLILDTDIGSDIDDAVCLAYLLAHPQCDLLGITTVSGEPLERAMMASAQCKVAGRRVPIFPGAPLPLITPVRQPKAQQAEALDRWPHDKNFPTGEAIEFLRQTIRQHPGEVTLLAIGPLTNIALLFRADPEIPALLKSLVLMAGRFAPQPPGDTWSKSEWNIWNDPFAAAMVYRTPVKIHRSIGLDVTRQVKMPAAEVRERFQTKLLRPVLDFAEVWFRKVEEIIFHDPLAAATIFDEQICQFERGTVDVQLADSTLGETWWQGRAASDDTTSGDHEVAFKVDSQRFFNHYFDIVTG